MATKTKATMAPSTLRLDGLSADASEAAQQRDDWSDLADLTDEAPSSPQAAAPAAEKSEQAEQQQHPAQELLDPSTGEVIDLSDVDAMAAAFERCKRIADQHYAARNMLGNALAALADGGDTKTKTRRVRGQRYRVKVEMPDDGWDQSMLREAWHSYPQHRESCLKIGTINVGLREWKKLTAESGPPDFELFRDMVRRANRGPSGNPRITVEAEIGDTGMAHRVKPAGE